MDRYGREVIREMRAEGWDDEYIQDWIRVYEETGLDMRDMADGMDVDEFLEAWEDDDLEAMLMMT